MDRFLSVHLPGFARTTLYIVNHSVSPGGGGMTEIPLVMGLKM